MSNAVDAYIGTSKKIREAIDRISTIYIMIGSIVKTIVDVAKTVETLEANVSLIVSTDDDATRMLLPILKLYADTLNSVKIIMVELANRVDEISKMLKSTQETGRKQEF